MFVPLPETKPVFIFYKYMLGAYFESIWKFWQLGIVFNVITAPRRASPYNHCYASEDDHKYHE